MTIWAVDLTIWVADLIWIFRYDDMGVTGFDDMGSKLGDFGDGLLNTVTYILNEIYMTIIFRP